jgi:hypothetical protein
VASAVRHVHRALIRHGHVRSCEVDTRVNHVPFGIAVLCTGASRIPRPARAAATAWARRRRSAPRRLNETAGVPAQSIWQRR